MSRKEAISWVRSLEHKVDSVGIADPVEEGWDVMEADWVVSNHNLPCNVVVQVVMVAVPVAVEVVRTGEHFVWGVVALVDVVEVVVVEAWDEILVLPVHHHRVHRTNEVVEVRQDRIWDPK